MRSTPCHLKVFFQNFQIEQLDRKRVLASVIHELRFATFWITTVRILVFGQMELDLRTPASHPLSLETHTNSRTSIPTNLDFLIHSWAMLHLIMNLGGTAQFMSKGCEAHEWRGETQVLGTFSAWKLFQQIHQRVYCLMQGIIPCLMYPAKHGLDWLMKANYMRWDSMKYCEISDLTSWDWFLDSHLNIV
jgi:hypothetical protein